jgi:hypothetical protein
MLEVVLTIVTGVLSLNAAIVLFIALIGGGLLYGQTCHPERYAGRRRTGVVLIVATGAASVLSLVGGIEPRWMILAVCAPQAAIGLLIWRNSYWSDHQWHASRPRADLEA